ncbi:MAG: Crp/Fnr family transcriptional regulator [Hyphomicrobiaceae bacterium]
MEHVENRNVAAATAPKASTILEDCIAAGSVRRISSKEHLFLDGDQQSHVYLLEAGTILLYKILPDGKRQVVDIAFPGDVVGLGLSGNHSFNAQATEPTRVRCLPVAALHQLAQRNPQLSLKLYEVLAQELSAARQHLLTISTRDAGARVASFLMALMHRNEQRGHSVSELVLPMRRADIGDFLGLTIETVSRTFSRLKADGIIDVDHGGYVEILDTAALGAVAEGQLELA